MGAHAVEHNGVPRWFSRLGAQCGASFRHGDFNGWNKTRHMLQPGPFGVWSGFVPQLSRGTTYKCHIVSRDKGYAVDKADPCGVRHETAPRTASLVWDLNYTWGDAEWMKSRPA
jgi:1,4-alpha-glucan branching enzyme